MFNDNTILEYILQDDVFMGIIGMFECKCWQTRNMCLY
jgi:hypothetical protein